MHSSLSCPPVSEPSMTCHVSKLTNGLLPLPPLLSVSPRLQCATFLSSPTHSSLFLPSSQSALPSYHLSYLSNPPLPLPPFRQASHLFPLSTASQLPVRYKSPTLRAYIDAECGSLDALYLEILGDFF